MTVDITHRTQKQPGQRYGFHLKTFADYPMFTRHEEKALAMYYRVLGTLEKIVNPEMQAVALSISTSPYETDIQLVVQPRENQEEPGEVKLQEEELQIVLIATQKVFDEIKIGCDSIVKTIDGALDNMPGDEDV